MDVNKFLAETYHGLYTTETYLRILNEPLKIIFYKSLYKLQTLVDTLKNQVIKHRLI